MSSSDGGCCVPSKLLESSTSGSVDSASDILSESVVSVITELKLDKSETACGFETGKLLVNMMLYCQKKKVSNESKLSK